MDLLEEGLRIGGITENVGDYRRYLSTPSRTRTHEATSGPDASVDDDAVPPPPPVDRFVFVSESCLPLMTLREFEMALFGPRDDPEDDDAGSVVVATGKQSSSKEGQSPYDKSWIRARSTPNNGYARQLQWDAIRERDVPSRYVWKADQWVALTRAHAEAISSLTNGRYLDGRSLWPAFRDVREEEEETATAGGSSATGGVDDHHRGSVDDPSSRGGYGGAGGGRGDHGRRRREDGSRHDRRDNRRRRRGEDDHHDGSTLAWRARREGRRDIRTRRRRVDRTA